MKSACARMVTKRVPFGELFRFLRNRPPHQSTPGAERLATGRYAFPAFVRRVFDARRFHPVLSVSRENFRGPKATLKVASAHRNLGPKVSKSLINTPPKVNTLVAFGVRSGLERPGFSSDRQCYAFRFVRNTASKSESTIVCPTFSARNLICGQFS